MPSTMHEALLLLFRNMPQLVWELGSESAQQATSQPAKVQIVSQDVTETVPVERRADLVMLLGGEKDRRALIIEAQLSPDPRKRESWLVYLAGVRARYRCLTSLLVVTTTQEMADWCAQPIETGHPGLVLTPLVLGPKSVPVVRDVAEVLARPELAVLSVLMHGRSHAGEAIARAFLAAAPRFAGRLDEDRITLYVDLVLVSVNEETRRSLEEVLKGEPQSELLRMVKAQGNAEGMAEAVLEVLAARGIEVPEDVRARVLGSTERDELKGWLRRAAVVGDARELFTATLP